MQLPRPHRDRRPCHRRRSVWHVLLICVAAATGCSQANVYDEPPPPEVPVTTPRRQQVIEYVEQTGTAQASERVELRARVSGFLVERHFKDGEMVTAGQTLFLIDEEPFKVSLLQAKARQSEAEAALRQARQSKTRETNRAQLKLSEAELKLAKSQLDRADALVKRDALPVQDLERSAAQYSKAEAQVDSDRAQLEQSEADYETHIFRAQSTLQAAEADVRSAELELSYCRVHSPIDGQISSRTYDVGNYITTGTSSALATIVRLSPIYVNITPSEAEWIRMRGAHGRPNSTAMEVQVGVDGKGDYPIKGIVDYVAPGVDESTGTIHVRAVVNNTDGVILPGLLVRARVSAEVRANALVVSERSIGYDQAGSFVYVVNANNTIERRNVVPSSAQNGDRAVAGKLDVTDRIVVDGLLRVRPGMVVVPKDSSTIVDADRSKTASRR